jgi:hypothetical protein
MTPVAGVGKGMCAPEELDEKVSAFLTDLRDDQVIRAHIRRVLMSYASNRGIAIGDPRETVEEIVAEVLAQKWAHRREKFALQPMETWRGAAFIRGRIYAWRHVDALVLERRVHRHQMHQSTLADDRVPNSLAVPGPVGYADGFSRRRGDGADVLYEASRRLREMLVAAPGVGEDGWERLLARLSRSPNLRADVEALLEALVAGDTEVDLKPVLAAVTNWHTWALARLGRGENLSTLDAVASGTHSDVKSALEEAGRWFLLNRDHTAGPVCVGQMIDAGLFDHEPFRVRHRKAARVLKHLVATHPRIAHLIHLDAACARPEVDCEHQVEAYGVNVESVAAQATFKQVVA